MMTKLTAISLVVVAASFPGTSMAASCGSGISGQSPAVKMLQRQLSALRSIQRGRGCKPGDTGGGFFNACREVGMKINEAQQELRATAAANNECWAEARTGRTARAATKPQAMNVSAAGNARSQPASTTPKKVRGPKTSISSTKPSRSTARHRKCRSPLIVTTASSRCHLSPRRGVRRRIVLA